MRERGIDVLEMHNLLTETIQNPEALKWILDRKITADSVGLGLILGAGRTGLRLCNEEYPCKFLLKALPLLSAA